MNKEEYINHKLVQVEDDFNYQKQRLNAIKFVSLLQAYFFCGLGLIMLPGGLFFHAATALSISASAFFINKDSKKNIKNLYKNKEIETNHLLNLKIKTPKDDANTNNKRQEIIQELRKKRKLLDNKSSKYTKLIVGSVAATLALGILFPFSTISTLAFLGEVVVMKHSLNKKQKIDKEYNTTTSRIANLENDLKIIKSSHPKQRIKLTNTNQVERVNNNNRNKYNNSSIKRFNESNLNYEEKYDLNLQNTMIDEYVDSIEKTHIENYESPVQKVKR